MIKKKNIVPVLIFLCGVISIFIYFEFENDQKNKELQDFGVLTIGHIDRVITIRTVKSTIKSYKYRYLFKGKTYFSESSYNNIYKDKIVGLFFEVLVSTNNPEVSEIILTRQVTDTNLIKEAGYFNTLIRKKRK